MTEVLPVLAVVAVLAILLAGLAWIGRRARRHGVAGAGVAGAGVAGALAAYDEAFHGTAHDSYVEVQAQADRTVPIPSPDKG